MHKQHVQWIAFLTLSALMIGGALLPTRASAQSGLTITAQAGFDGFYKIDDWLPVHVTISNDGPGIDADLELLVGENLGGETVIYKQHAILPTHSRKQFTLYAMVTNYTHQLVVRLVQKKKLIAKYSISIEPLSAQDFLCVVVSDDVSALNYLAGLPPSGQGRIYVAHIALQDIPEQGRAMGAVDALILHNTDTAPMRETQRQALRGWVAFGGHLIIVGGPGAAPTAAGLGDLLPVRITGSQSTDDLGALGDLAGTPLTANTAAVVAQVEPLPQGKYPPGHILAGSADLPLLVRRYLDQGHIDYFAPDPNLEPLRTWIGNDRLWPQLFFSTPLALRPGRAKIGWGALGAVLANIPSLDIPSVLLVIAFLACYIIIVGPLNLLILKLLDKRALAWITIPVLIILFSCAAYAIGFISRGHKVVISEITIIRSQPHSQMAAVDTFVGLYSPVRKRYDVRMPDNTLIRPLARSTYSTGGITGQELWVEQGPPTYLRDFEINVGAMRSLASHDLYAWPGLETNLTLSQPNSNTYHIQGTITNHSGAAIRNSILVLNKQPIKIDDLENEATANISVYFSVQSPTASNQIINILTGSPGIGKQRREYTRRGEILNNVLSPYYYRGTNAAPISLHSLTLLGWMDQSPTQIEVEQTGATLNASTLLVAYLALADSPETQIAVPKGFMAWQVIDGEPDATPHSLYSYQPATTFRFLVPGAPSLTVENLILYVDAINQKPFGDPPVVYIQDVSADKWVTLPNLEWGANELPQPQRFIRPDGSIDVRVSPQTIKAPLSIDFSIDSAGATP